MQLPQDRKHCHDWKSWSSRNTPISDSRVVIPSVVRLDNIVRNTFEIHLCVNFFFVFIFKILESSIVKSATGLEQNQIIIYIVSFNIKHLIALSTFIILFFIFLLYVV